MSNLDWVYQLQEDSQRMREALERLRDCDWVITLPDRMDAVRKIAREALAPSEEPPDDQP